MNKRIMSVGTGLIRKGKVITKSVSAAVADPTAASGKTALWVKRGRKMRSALGSAIRYSSSVKPSTVTLAVKSFKARPILVTPVSFKTTLPLNMIIPWQPSTKRVRRFRFDVKKRVIITKKLADLPYKTYTIGQEKRFVRAFMLRGFGNENGYLEKKSDFLLRNKINPVVFNDWINEISSLGTLKETSIVSKERYVGLSLNTAITLFNNPTLCSVSTSRLYGMNNAAQQIFKNYFIDVITHLV